MIKKHILLLLISLLFFPPCIYSLERFDIITTADMEQMLLDRENGKIDFLLVNGLDRMIHEYAAIPGSINIPLSSYKKYSSRMGSDKDKLIITYCMGYR